jgi:hypothetical protein
MKLRAVALVVAALLPLIANGKATGQETISQETILILDDEAGCDPCFPELDGPVVDAANLLDQSSKEQLAMFLNAVANGEVAISPTLASTCITRCSTW